MIFMRDEAEEMVTEVIHPDLLTAQKLAYEPSQFTLRKLKIAKSQEYGASIFEINDRRIKFRVAKITPTKVGQFVTLWKRFGDGPITPFDEEDPFDLFVISVRKEELLGQFVFPKSVLLKKGIISKGGVGGKRAIRVYPLWDKTKSPQAKNTQKWQLGYFFEIKINGKTDLEKVKELYSAQ